MLEFIDVEKYKLQITNHFLSNSVEFDEFKDSPAGWLNNWSKKYMNMAKIEERKKCNIYKGENIRSEIIAERGTFSVNKTDFNYDAVYIIPKETIFTKINPQRDFNSNNVSCLWAGIPVGVFVYGKENEIYSDVVLNLFHFFWRKTDKFDYLLPKGDSLKIKPQKIIDNYLAQHRLANIR